MKPPTKAQLISRIAEETGLTRADVTAVFDALYQQIETCLDGGNGAGFFNLPGLLKIQVARKPSSEARTGLNPLTGETITIAAKPERNVIRLKALKGLRDMVETP